MGFGIWDLERRAKDRPISHIPYPKAKGQHSNEHWPFDTRKIVELRCATGRGGRGRQHGTKDFYTGAAGDVDVLDDLAVGRIG